MDDAFESSFFFFVEFVLTLDGLLLDFEFGFFEFCVVDVFCRGFDALSCEFSFGLNAIGRVAFLLRFFDDSVGIGADSAGVALCFFEQSDGFESSFFAVGFRFGTNFFGIIARRFDRRIDFARIGRTPHVATCTHTYACTCCQSQDCPHNGSHISLQFFVDYRFVVVIAAHRRLLFLMNYCRAEADRVCDEFFAAFRRLALFAFGRLAFAMRILPPWRRQSLVSRVCIVQKPPRTGKYDCEELSSALWEYCRLYT